MGLLASESDEPEIKLKDPNLQLMVTLLISVLSKEIRMLEHNTKLPIATSHKSKSSNQQPVLSSVASQCPLSFPSHRFL